MDHPVRAQHAHINLKNHTSVKPEPETTSSRHATRAYCLINLREFGVRTPGYLSVTASEAMSRNGNKFSGIKCYPELTFINFTLNEKQSEYPFLFKV
jgi:hypothetical protein